MCGFAGIFDHARRQGSVELKESAGAMAKTLAHRGPDDSGVWSDPENGVALAHRRLSIIDLSAQGHQPMLSADGRMALAYNGEIYNFAELRAALEKYGVVFRGNSDSEVLVEGFCRWGVPETLKRSIGMFAFALWDHGDKSLTLGRDRMGIKPLYWAEFGDVVLFGSELKALFVHPAWKGEIDQRALAAYLRFSYVPAPMSIFKNVHKLLPGHLLTIKTHQLPKSESYWDLSSVVKEGLRDPLFLSPQSIVDEAETLLRDAVKKRMVADVELGALLSGGIDSTLVTALMQAQSPKRMKTFTIGFGEGAYDEARDAQAIARHLNTEHHELNVTPEHAQKVIPALPDIYDEPFADSSQIPTYLVCEMARRKVSVALSGDGGDEVFLGYNRYAWATRVGNWNAFWPHGLQQKAAWVFNNLSPHTLDRFFALLPASRRPRLAGEKLHKLASVLGLQGRDAIYRRLVSQWDEADIPQRGEPFQSGPLWDDDVRKTVPDFTERMVFLDMATYLPDDILTKLDRASMAVGLEARVPLLDHRLVEWIWRLPLSRRTGKDMKEGANKKHPKWIGREVLYRYVPRALVDRPKMGFGLPIDSWLRGSLRQWAEELLDEKRLEKAGLMNPAPIRRAWADHLSGKANNQHALWGILMFEAWRERHKDVIA